MFSATTTQAPSFEEYAVASWSMLYRSAYLLAGNHADAEDLAQQTLIKAHGAWAKVSASDSMHAYVRRILTNTFLSSRRPKGRRLELLTDDVPEWGRAPGLPGSTAGMPGASDERMTLWCSRGTVKSTAHRALKSLKAALEASDDQTRAEPDGKEA